MAIDLNGSTGISLDDNEKINIGNDSDLQIYHDGSNSIIHDNGTGNLQIRAGNLNILNATATENYLSADNGGAVNLFYNNSKKFETTSTGIDVTGSINLNTTNTFVTGAGHNVLQVDATKTYLYGGTGGVQVRTADNVSALVDITNAGKVMIGTTTEGQGQADNLTISDSGHMGMTIRSTDSHECSIFFSDATSGAGEYAGAVQYSHSDNALIFSSNSVARMRIDSSGAVTKPNQPYFNVQKSSSQNNITAGAYTTVTFGTEHVDTGGNFANNTFTAPVTGVYSLSIGVRLDNVDTSASYYNFWLQTSNRAYHQLRDVKFSQDSIFIFAMNVIADMDANDTAVFQIQQQGGATQTDINSSTFFQGYLLG
jgi:hypothetical protein